MKETAQQTNPQSVTPLQTPSSSKNFVTIAIVAIVAAFLASLGTYLVMSSNQNKRSQMSYRPTPQITQSVISPTTIEEPIENATAGYETYSANKFANKYGAAYRFSVNYPGDWNPRDHDYGTGADFAFLSPDYKTPEQGPGEEILKGGRIEVFILPNQKITTLEDWVKTHYSNPQTNETFVTTRTKMIGDKQILEFEYRDSDTGKIDMVMPHTTHTEVFSVGNTVYEVQAVARESSVEYISIVEKIVESFKSTP